MGQYVISVMGQGPHHNEGETGQDANQLAAKFVAALKANGHRIYDASFVVIAEGGLRDNLEEG